jgi:hypothetical protein
MRLTVLLIALLSTSAVGAESMTTTPAPGMSGPAPVSPAGSAEGRVPCRDTIHQVRDERGLPRLQRETAVPHEPLLIAAVDHRIDGCSVMVVYGNTSDVRPLPAMPDGSPSLQRIWAR